MTQAKTWVGLDVHAAKVVAAITDAESGELQTRRLSGRTAKVVELCSSLPAPVKVSYEAGPTGFGLARALEQAGVGCLIAAPGKIARPATDRVKTDRRDAELLVRLLMAGQLSAVRVPSVREEACRDLVRAREDVRGDLMRARHRVGKLLLRHDRRFDGNNWTQAHRQWLNDVELDDSVAQTVLLTRSAQSTRCSSVARRSSARWLRSSPTHRGRRRSAGCAACAGSTPSPPSGWPPRSVTSSASTGPGG